MNNVKKVIKLSLKLLGFVILCLLFIALCVSCSREESETSESSETSKTSKASVSLDTSDTSGIAEIVQAYIDGFTKFYEKGNEYTNLGLQLQAKYAYGWSCASVSSMRYCVDNLLYLKGAGETLEEVVGNRPDNWDEIAAMNFASPYPYFFEGLVYSYQEKNDDAQSCYEKALINPAFSAENDQSLMVIITMSVDELKSVKKKLTELEEKILTVYTPEKTHYPRTEFNFSDKYLRTLAQEKLKADESDYRGALRYYEAALSVNPFEGDNFVGCALMHLYLNEIDNTFFYVNEGLYVDPDHDGLKKIADILNGEV